MLACPFVIGFLGTKAANACKFSVYRAPSYRKTIAAIRKMLTAA